MTNIYCTVFSVQLMCECESHIVYACSGMWWMHVCITDWLLPDKCERGVAVLRIFVYAVLFCISFLLCVQFYLVNVTIYLFIYFMRIPFCWECVLNVYVISIPYHIIFAALLMCTLCMCVMFFFCFCWMCCGVVCFSFGFFFLLLLFLLANWHANCFLLFFEYLIC